jgi:SulP family sulfate permease
MTSNWITAVFSGLTIGAISIIASVSMAALVFAGSLEAHLAYGINIALVTAVITGAILAFSSTCEIAISIPQDRTAPIIAFMAAGIASTAAAETPADQLLMTVVAAIVATSLITGTFLYILGMSRAGGLMRFIPYSVLGGFFAGTGWLLLIGGMRAMTGLELGSLNEIEILTASEQLQFWLPGALLAAAIMVVSRLLSSGLALFATLLLAGGLFFVLMFNQGETLITLGEAGWLLGPLEHNPFRPLELGLPRLVTSGDWSVVFSQWQNIGTVVAISSVSIMLTVSALEMLSGRDIDINHELRVSGIANLAAGVSGGMVGFHSLSLSNLSMKLGANSRLTGIIAAATTGAALYIGTETIGMLPRFIVGGLLIYLGASFLIKWLFASWGKVPHGEYLVIPLILITIAGIGFIEGLFVGLLAALIQFVLKYSRTAVIRYVASGANTRSAVDRGIEETRFLAREGERMLILRLRGYLFFGTTAQLSSQVRSRTEDSTKPPLACLVLDFQAVNGIDSSATYEFHRLRQMAEKHGFTILLTGLAKDLQHQLRASHAIEHDEDFRLFPDLDHGLEWYEEQALSTYRDTAADEPSTALQLLGKRFPDSAARSEFSKFLSPIPFTAGEQLIRQGDAASDLFFLEQGNVSVYLEKGNGERLRIRRTGPGTVLGGGCKDTEPTTAIELEDMTDWTRTTSSRSPSRRTVHGAAQDLQAQAPANHRPQTTSAPC